MTARNFDWFHELFWNYGYRRRRLKKLEWKPLLRLLGVTLDTDDVLIKEAIKSQNKSLLEEVEEEEREARVVMRVRRSTEAVAGVILEVGPALWAALKYRKVRVGFQIIPVV
ncbi:unnamed protein product [Chilo suppressalis]|uniref:Uncharacterized protein n=1 Tax=Chilo suppressalis TaxID=168631 RepID=A0ABN8AQS8_CHISP|nr:unnamed protein product [Chilo suppressalis]